MIKMQIIGNLGKDAEVKVYGSESVINFSVAHTDKYKDGTGTYVSKTTWVSCSWWVERHAVAQYMKKGTQVWVEGIPEARMWKEKPSGESKCGISLRVYSLQLLGSGNRSDNDQKPTQNQNTSITPPTEAGYTPIDDFSDLPF